MQASAYHPSLARSPPFSESSVSEYTTRVGGRTVKGWQHLDRFQSQSNHKNTHILFCGGPIRTLVWVPQTDYKDQYLAVSCQTNGDSPYISSRSASQTCLQIWRQRITDQTMELQYCVALDNGPIRCVTFCPSGGCDTLANRLAIAAVPTISGDVHLLALPSPDETTTTSTTIPLGGMLKIAPSVVLQSCGQSGQITHIAWSKVNRIISRPRP